MLLDIFMGLLRGSANAGGVRGLMSGGQPRRAITPVGKIPLPLGSGGRVRSGRLALELLVVTPAHDGVVVPHGAAVSVTQRHFPIGAERRVEVASQVLAPTDQGAVELGNAAHPADVDCSGPECDLGRFGERQNSTWSPTLERPVSMQPAAAERPPEDVVEDRCRRDCFALLTPTLHCAVERERAAMVIAGCDFGEGAARRIGLATLFDRARRVSLTGAPTNDAAAFRDRAAVQVPRRHLSKDSARSLRLTALVVDAVLIRRASTNAEQRAVEAKCASVKAAERHRAELAHGGCLSITPTRDAVVRPNLATLVPGGGDAQCRTTGPIGARRVRTRSAHPRRERACPITDRPSFAAGS